jgi:hypothetical protein
VREFRWKLRSACREPRDNLPRDHYDARRPSTNALTSGILDRRHYTSIAVRQAAGSLGGVPSAHAHLTSARELTKG